MVYIKKIIEKYIQKINQMNKYDRLAWYLIVFGTLLRFFILLFVDVSGEPTWHMNVARYMAVNFKIPLFEHLGRDVFWAPPVYHILMAIFYKLFSFFGDNVAIFAAQLVTPILAGFTLLFNYLIVKHLFNNKIGFYSTLFLVFLPAHIYFSTLAYTDMALMLFVLMSIYYTLKKRYAWSGLFSAISMLTKYTGLFVILIVIPLIIVREKKNIKSYLEYFIFIPLGFIWFIRNWILLGNPVWHFLNNLFGGYESFVTKAYHSSFSHLISLKPLTTLYAGLLGIPASTWSNLFYFKFPFIKIFLIIWLFGTGLFFLPVLFGLKNIRRQIKIIIFWLIPFILMAFVYIYNIGGLFLRFLFPVLPIMGICWAFGFIKIKKIHPKLIMSVLILILLGITTVEFSKAYTSSARIEKYQVDFDWVKQNTNGNDIFLIEGEQTLSFHLNRYTYYFLEIENLSNIDYVWINPTLTSSYDYDNLFINELKKEHVLVYSNDFTKTKIYKVKK